MGGCGSLPIITGMRPDRWTGLSSMNSSNAQVPSLQSSGMDDPERSGERPEGDAVAPGAAPDGGPQPRRAAPPPRRRRLLRVVAAVAAVATLWLAFSLGGALTAPGTDGIDARVAEWARSNGLGWVVDELERVQYALNPPRLGGTVQGGIPDVSPIVGELSPGDSGSPSAAPAPAPSEPPQTPSPGATPGASPSLGPSPAPTPLPAPDPIQPMVGPALPGEGVWKTLALLHGQPAIRVAYLRPDAQHTSYLVAVAWIDQNLVGLVLHPGFLLPGGTGWSQPSDVPASQRDALLATFNSGFRLADANGGYWEDGRSAAPLRPGAASMVFYKDGRLDVVRWSAAMLGPDVAAVRQSLVLLVDDGSITPEVTSETQAAWGLTFTGAASVWRTALGIRADGSLVFVVGPAMSVRTLASIVQAAGAVRAMQLDINYSWTNFMTYTHPSHGVAVPHMLNGDAQPNPYRYLYPSSRDFVAVLARS